MLVGGEMFSGWGIRTIGVAEARFNPMAYHNGTVWPHDTGLAAAGFSRYGFDDLVSAPFSGLFEAAVAVEAAEARRTTLARRSILSAAHHWRGRRASYSA